MDNHQFVQVTRTLVKRGLTDFERKFVAFFVCGAAGDAALNLLAAYHVALPATVAPLIPWACGALGGYMTHSLGSVTTVNTTPAGVTSVSTSTGSIRIPAAYVPQPTPTPDPEPMPEVPDVAPVPAAVNTAGDSVTQIMNPNDRFASILGSLPSATGASVPADSH